MKNKSIGIIGLGNLGVSLLEGMLSDPSFSEHELWATKRQLKGVMHFAEKGVHLTSNNVDAVRNTALILLAVKPHHLDVVLGSIDEFVTENHVLVSLVSGVSLEEISTRLSSKPKLFRAMPNTASSVGESITCISTKVTDVASKETVNQIFETLGATVEIDDNLMDAATVLGACGIAFVLRFMRAMTQGGIQIGFNAETASTIVNQTVLGATSLLIQKGQHPEQEIDKVTTPKGCTIAGLNEMEHYGFSSALIRGIVTSYKEINS